ncbi:MAG: hypothetical protein AAGC55_31660, partial [Myxococcota bacterium]
MAEIAVFCYSRSLAHAGRAVAVARALVGDGHRVTLFGQPHYLESSLLVAPAEFPLRVVYEPPLDQVLGAVRGRSGPAGDPAAALAGAVFEELRIFESWRPDVVVTDNRRSAVLSAEIAGIPSVSLSNASLLGSLCAIDPTIAELAEICAPAFGRIPGEITAAPEFAGQDHQTPVPTRAIPLEPGILEFCAQFKIRQRRHVHELCLGTRTLILDVPELYPVRDIPDSVAVVGPILFDVAAALP